MDIAQEMAERHSQGARLARLGELRWTWHWPGLRIEHCQEGVAGELPQKSVRAAEARVECTQGLHNRQRGRGPCHADWLGEFGKDNGVRGFEKGLALGGPIWPADTERGTTASPRVDYRRRVHDVGVSIGRA